MTRPAVSAGFWVTLAILLFLGWQAARAFSEMRRPLTSYQRLSGPLQTASLKYRPGKNGYWFVLFTLACSPQRFGLRHEGRALLAQLTPLLHGPDLTVYAGVPGSLLANDVNFDVVQLEAPGQVLVSLNDAHGRAASAFAWLLVALAVALPITLKFYFDQRAVRRADDDL